jgi:hypothetical protein
MAGYSRLRPLNKEKCQILILLPANGLTVNGLNLFEIAFNVFCKPVFINIFISDFLHLIFA